MGLGKYIGKVKIYFYSAKNLLAASFLFPWVASFLFSKLALNTLVNQGLPWTPSWIRACPEAKQLRGKIKPAENSSPHGQKPPSSLAGHRTFCDSDALMTLVLESLGSQISISSEFVIPGNGLFLRKMIYCFILVKASYFSYTRFVLKSAILFFK